MGLPGKNLLALDEVIARWKHWGCDHATLQSYAQNDQLVFSVYLRDIGSHKSVRTEGDAVITREVQVMKFVSPNAVIRRLFYLDGDDTRRVLESVANEQIAVHALYWTPQRIKKQATYHSSAKYFTPQDLVVTREECERFERQHKANGIHGLSKKALHWIKEPSPSNTATRIGGGIVIVATAIWAVFKWYASTFAI